MRLLVGIDVPDDLRGIPVNDAIRRWAHWVRVGVVASRRHCEMRRGGDNGCHVPCKGDHLVFCDFVVGRCRLRWLQDGEPTSSSGLRNRER